MRAGARASKLSSWRRKSFQRPAQLASRPDGILSYTHRTSRVRPCPWGGTSARKLRFMPPMRGRRSWCTAPMPKHRGVQAKRWMAALRWISKREPQVAKSDRVSEHVRRSASLESNERQVRSAPKNGRSSEMLLARPRIPFFRIQKRKLGPRWPTLRPRRT